eukprot:TRINITY_DN21007_c0_g1_i2.p1 TRINITY_DN21007_c0_g1~~TRINITY_DN21007_c0_g1_i2.p1  ORF type:complete len:580 (+),score=95.93 TRINITY_DN21007_c0_g1_i2:51-1790(+)
MTRKIAARTYKAVLVPEGSASTKNALSPAFRNLLSQLATQHLQELEDQRTGLLKQVNEMWPKLQPVSLETELSTIREELAIMRNQMSPAASKMPTSIEKGPDKSGGPDPPLEPAPSLPGEIADGESESPEAIEAVQVPRRKNRVSVFPTTEKKDLDAKEGEEEEEKKPIVRSATTTAPKTIPEQIKVALMSSKFEFAIGSLIMINVFTMMLQLQYDGMDNGFDLQYQWFERPAIELWPSAPDALAIVETFFTVVFTTDVVLRIIFCGCDFWRSPLNIVDFFVVLFGLLAIAFEFMSAVGNPSFVRMLRLVKIGRGLKALEHSPAVQSLQLLLKCLTASINTLFWSLCVLVGIQCIAAMVLGTALKDFLSDQNVDVEIRKSIFRYYGTFTKTMMTMFEILFANWIPAARVLIENVSEWWALVFVLYRCLVGFAVLNVVNAVFVQSTMKVAQQDQELLIAQKHRAAETTKRNLNNLFMEIDTSGDGELSYSELMAVLEDANMKLWMSALEIETHDLTTLFKLLDDGDGNISTEEFLDGIGRLKGPAKAIDLASLLSQVVRMHEKIDEIHAKSTGRARNSES